MRSGWLTFSFTVDLPEESRAPSDFLENGLLAWYRYLYLEEPEISRVSTFKYDERKILDLIHW